MREYRCRTVDPIVTPWSTVSLPEREPLKSFAKVYAQQLWCDAEMFDRYRVQVEADVVHTFDVECRMVMPEFTATEIKDGG